MKSETCMKIEFGDFETDFDKGVISFSENFEVTSVQNVTKH